jgi:hypothetical protein
MIKILWSLTRISTVFKLSINNWVKRKFITFDTDSKSIAFDLQQSYINNFIDDTKFIQELVEKYVLLRIAVFNHLLNINK